MTKKSRKRTLFKKKWLAKYRIIFLNEETFEERFAMRLTRFNVFIALFSTAIVLVFLTALLIAYTPLREYIPGYTSPNLYKQVISLNKLTDSLYAATQFNDEYIKSIKKVLTGEANFESINKDSIYSSLKIKIDTSGLNRSKQDSIFRERVDREDRYSLFKTASPPKKLNFSPPVNGTISSGFDLKNRHYAVDVVVVEGTPVKSIAAGRVIFASWTSDTGNVIIIDHGEKILSVYKHNRSLISRQGDFVKAKEVIASSGSSGELSSGPHLHFELWSDGNPIDPTLFINF